MNFIRKFIGATPTDEIASIPSGKLYLTRSKYSPKGALECLYNDAFAAIKQTTTPFYYQLFINRVYQEGELDDVQNSEDSENEDESTSSRKDSLKDEWVFPIEQNLKLYTYEKSNSNRVIVWKDPNGDVGDNFEFIVDEEVRSNNVDSFVLTLYKCMYENKYRESSLGFNSLDDLKDFIYEPRSEALELEGLQKTSDSEEVNEDEIEEVYFEGRENHDHGMDKEPEEIQKEEQEGKDFHYDTSTEPMGAIKAQTRNISLHLYNATTGSFVTKLEAPNVVLKLIGLGAFENTLFIHSLDPATRLRINAPLNRSMSPTFNYEHLSFIFNHYIVEGGELSSYSWLVKFPTFNDLSDFQRKFLGLMYETLNKKKWGEKTEQDYFVNAFSELTVDDA